MLLSISPSVWPLGEKPPPMCRMKRGRWGWSCCCEDRVHHPFYVRHWQGLCQEYFRPESTELVGAPGKPAVYPHILLFGHHHSLYRRKMNNHDRQKCTPVWYGRRKITAIFLVLRPPPKPVPPNYEKPLSAENVPPYGIFADRSRLQSTRMPE